MLGLACKQRAFAKRGCCGSTPAFGSKGKAILQSIILGTILIVVGVIIRLRLGLWPTIEGYSSRILSGALIVLGSLLLMKELM